MYNENDYEIKYKQYSSNNTTRKYDKDPILTQATVIIKGARFEIDRVFTKLGNPSRVFLFRTEQEFNDKNELIEIGWDTCSSGLMKIAEGLHLKFVPSSSCFSQGKCRCHFLEEEHDKAIL